MIQSIVHIALVVNDYDEAIEFYTKKLHFTLVEDIYQPEQDKRWVVVAPPGSAGTTLLLARASKPEQEPFVGNQAGGRTGISIFEHGRLLARLSGDGRERNRICPRTERRLLRNRGGIQRPVRKSVGSAAIERRSSNYASYEGVSLC